jgi:hypothetical protein
VSTIEQCWILWSTPNSPKMAAILCLSKCTVTVLITSTSARDSGTKVVHSSCRLWPDLGRQNFRSTGDSRQSIR